MGRNAAYYLAVYGYYFGRAVAASLERPAQSIKAPHMLEEVFNLEEGPVTLSVPAVLSPESYQDIADRLSIFLRGLKRRADAEAARRRLDGDDIPE